MAIHVNPIAARPAAATTTTATAVIRTRKVRDRVVEKHDQMNDQMLIRIRCRRAIKRGAGFDHRGICGRTSSMGPLRANNTSTAEAAADGGASASLAEAGTAGASLHAATAGVAGRSNVMASVACIQSGRVSGEAEAETVSSMRGVASLEVDIHSRRV
jgi:hypothetical protein